MKKIFWITIGLTAFFLLPQKAFAATVENKVERTYTAHTEYMEIVEIHKLSISRSGFRIRAGTTETLVLLNFINEPKSLADKLAFIKNSLKVTDENGETMSISFVPDNSSVKFTVRIPVDVVLGETFEYKVVYRVPDMVRTIGALSDIYIPAFDKNFEFTVADQQRVFTTKLKIPTSLGDINFVIPKMAVLNSGGFWEIDVPTENLVGQYLWVQMGTTQFYKFEIKQPFQRSTSSPLLINDFEIVLPRDYENSRIVQEVFFTKLSPQPEYIRKDSQGNLIAHYALAASESGEIIIAGYAKLLERPNPINDQSGDINQYSTGELDLTKQAPFWEVDSPEIQSKARSLKLEETNVYRLVEKTYKDIVNTIDYQDISRFGITKRKGALATLKGGAAVCMEYSDLFITLMRAQGIPARAAYGYGYDAREGDLPTVGHQWAEVYFPEIQKWVPVDVTWGESGQVLIGGDLNHLYTHVAERNVDDPPQVKTRYFGNDPTPDPLALNVLAVKELPTNEKLTTAAELERTFQSAPFGGRIALTIRSIDNFVIRLFAGTASPRFASIIFYLSPVIIAAVSIGVIRLRKKIQVRKQELYYPDFPGAGINS